MFDQDLESRLRRKTRLKVSTLETLALLRINLVLEQTKFASLLSINLLQCCEHGRAWRRSLHRGLFIAAQLCFTYHQDRLWVLSTIPKPHNGCKENLCLEEETLTGAQASSWWWTGRRRNRPAEQLQFMEHLFRYSTENKVFPLLFKAAAVVCSYARIKAINN